MTADQGRTFTGDDTRQGGEAFAAGGFVEGGGPAWTRVHPDECLLTTNAVCMRDDHPTPTSDCTTVEWIRHTSVGAVS